MLKLPASFSGRPWTRAQRLAVWNRARVESGRDPDHFRRDVCGTWMDFLEFEEAVEGGDGWFIVHIVPPAAGGSDAPENLQALHWRNAVAMAPKAARDS